MKQRLSEHFYRHEFACNCGCGFDTVDCELLGVLEVMRSDLGSNAIIITSGCRCRPHNIKEGGKTYSQHLYAKAVDFVVKNVHEDKVADYLESKYPHKYGIGRYPGRTHIDVRPNKKRWDKR